MQHQDESGPPPEDEAAARVDAEALATGLERLASMVREYPPLARGVRRYVRFMTVEAAELGPDPVQAFARVKSMVEERKVRAVLRSLLDNRLEFIAPLSPVVELIVMKDRRAR
jgi:hypothetical protein